MTSKQDKLTKIIRTENYRVNFTRDLATVMLSPVHWHRNRNLDTAPFERKAWSSPSDR